MTHLSQGSIRLQRFWGWSECRVGLAQLVLRLYGNVDYLGHHFPMSHTKAVMPR